MELSDKLSTNFTLGDLVYTTQPLSAPNLPPKGPYFDNLVFTADVLEELLTLFGFTIVSGFRTKELQQRLIDIGEPATSKLSFHEVGRAVDIIPDGISLADAFGLILANPIRERFAEIAFKPSQGSLHLAINVPGDIRVPKITAMNEAQQYGALSTEAIQGYIDRAIASVGDVSAAVSAQAPKIAVFAVGAVSLAAIYWMLMKKRES